MKKGNVKIAGKKDYIVELEGAYPFVLNQVVSFKTGAKGIVVEAKGKKASVALLEETIGLQVITGQMATMETEEFSITPSEKMLGTIVNVYGEVVYGKDYKPAAKAKRNPIFRMGRPIYSRDYVNRPLITGLTTVDWAIPIGMGQRELVLGDRKTGKTSMALNMILAQKHTNVKAVYVAIGQKKSTILDIQQKIEKGGMMDRTVIVSAPADDTATRKYLAPYTGVTIAEYFQEKFGDDVLIIYDDLSKHADAYREISLLLKTAPAREAYPGDVFYLHSKLLERAGSFAPDFGGGSITAIPIIQTEAGDITSYIPTNVISITDGQVFTSKAMFNAGLRPAIDVAYSVSRVGSTAQIPSMRKFAGGLKLVVSQFNEIMKIAKLSPQAADENKELIARGKALNALFLQGDLEVIKYEAGILMLILFKKGYLGFYKNDKEIIELKNIINTFIANDVVGKKLTSILRKPKLDFDKVDLIINQIVLPIVKYHLIQSFPELKERVEFVDTFGKVRDDSRVYRAIQKNIAQFAEGDEKTNMKVSKSAIDAAEEMTKKEDEEKAQAELKAAEKAAKKQVAAHPETIVAEEIIEEVENEIASADEEQEEVVVEEKAAAKPVKVTAVEVKPATKNIAKPVGTPIAVKAVAVAPKSKKRFGKKSKGGK